MVNYYEHGNSSNEKKKIQQKYPYKLNAVIKIIILQYKLLKVPISSLKMARMC